MIGKDDYKINQSNELSIEFEFEFWNRVGYYINI